MGLGQRLQHAWNVFSKPDRYPSTSNEFYGGYFTRPDRPKLRTSNERSIVTAILNRMAIDVAAVNIRHVKVDENGRYLNEVDSELNDCLKWNANFDQTAREFIQDAAFSLFDEGCIAIVPTVMDTDINPDTATFTSIDELRVGKITEWYPKAVKVLLYNEDKGIKEEVILPKTLVAIVENPLYAVMNEPNSTLRRLIHKLNLLDAIDEQSGSGKLDLIIQLPYTIKTQARREEANKRAKDIEMQLSGSKYGIAYTDGTERVIQLNRPVENNLMSQITYLTTQAYGQLGITENILNGTANEEENLNYYNRSIEPTLSAIVNAMNWKFLTKTARSRGHRIIFLRDPFRLVPVGQMAEIADKFTRNEILSSNEVRSIIGYKPVNDPRADELRNKNLNQDADAQTPVTTREGEGSEVKEQSNS